jgi:TrmH family RNA methyltransferase
VDIITSTQNDKVKLANALQTRTRARKKEGKIVLEGVRLIRDAWHNGAQPAFILHTPGTDDEFADKLARTGIDVHPVDDTVMRYVTDTQTPQGIVGVFPRPQPAYPPGAGRVLVLDALTDPGNVGTMLRTAAAAGVDVVVLAPGCVDVYNPKVLRGGMGAHFRLPVVEMSWSEIADVVSVDNAYLADADAATRYDRADWRGTWALVIGSEAHGASDAARQFARTPIFIPMAHDTESLNAAMAAAVILFEAARQLW